LKEGGGPPSCAGGRPPLGRDGGGETAVGVLGSVQEDVLVLVVMLALVGEDDLAPDELDLVEDEGLAIVRVLALVDEDDDAGRVAGGCVTVTVALTEEVDLVEEDSLALDRV
jgi:hypothetical protein